MYSPYGSYSSMSSNTQPLDITPSSYLSRDAAYHASCAFPSWPQRSSLMDPARDERATSYLSDDDLFPCHIEDDVHSVSSAGSTTSTTPFMSEEELLEMQRQKMAVQREAIKYLLNEKERRRQQVKRQRRSSGGGSSKKSSSPKAKQDQMAPITEAGE
ncbi:hypothetical protein F5Y19DRAFT_211348 [Xylariaceae sp. FL1651]|nr:hypothetical protein F5Y19DRAFT_211348 [Xylariaceae sp. FL1651]